MGMRREAHDALAAAGRRPRRRWGQHFLCDPGIVRRIVDAAAIDPDTSVLEIGPGLGALTDQLADAAAALHLIEIDPALAAHLRERFAARPSVHVVEGDVLALALSECVPAGAVVVANLPYNISTPVLVRLLEQRRHLPRAVLMLQREVAARLLAGPGGRDRGSLGVLVQTYADVRQVLRVPRGAFLPPPRVESSVVEVRWHATPRVPIRDEALYRLVVRAAFGQRRKMLRNALAALAAERGVTAPLETVLSGAGVAPTARAETLDLAAFARVADALAAPS